jgi:hypothetical protein
MADLNLLEPRSIDLSCLFLPCPQCPEIRARLVTHPVLYIGEHLTPGPDL